MPIVSKNAKPGEIPSSLRNVPVTEEPSQTRNNVDQVLQPTGDGGVAGGKIPPVGAAGNEPAEGPPTEKAKRYREGIRQGEEANARVDMRPDPTKKMVQMKLDRNYVPKGDYEIVGEAEKAPLAGTGTKGKLWAGTTVNLPADEAREVLKAGIGSRGDDF